MCTSNLSSSLSHSPSPPTGRTSQSGTRSWINSRGFCSAHGCFKLVTATSGVMCGNYSLQRGSFSDCEGSWCSGCYRLDGEAFRIRETIDDDGNVLEDMPAVEEANRFVTARPGDHLLTAFQCELCHFRNITGRDPTGRDSHQSCLLHIRRCNLDAFWSREPATVKSHLREGKRVERTGSKFGIGAIGPPLGPFPLSDDLGMRAALAVLDRSQDQTGINETFVQPDTYRKAQTFITNIYRASPAGLGEQIGAHDRRKVWISKAPTHTPWFSKFMSGLKRRTGEVVKQDKALTIDLLTNVLDLLENKWQSATAPKERLRIAQTAAWYAGGFCTALRGEEMLLIELAGTKRSLEHLNPNTNKHPYFTFVVNGRTKMNRDAGASFKIPCAAIYYHRN